MTITGSSLLRTYGVASDHARLAKKDAASCSYQRKKSNESSKPSEPLRFASNRQPHRVDSHRGSLPCPVTTSPPKALSIGGDDAVLASQVYAALDDPRLAVPLTCRDALELDASASAGGVRLYHRRKRPLVFAQIVGRIVGIEEKERKIIFLVDDGSAVVAVHIPLFKEAPQISSSPNVAASIPPRKGKERETPSGIPHQYIRPLEPQLPPSPRRKASCNIGEASREVALKQRQHLTITALVTVVGRVSSWYVGEGEIYLAADRVVPRKSGCHNRAVRAPNEGYIALTDDPNDEPLHLLKALQSYEEGRGQGNKGVHAARGTTPSHRKEISAARCKRGANAGETKDIPVKRLRTYGGEVNSSTGIQGTDDRKEQIDRIPNQSSCQPNAASAVKRKRLRQLRDYRKLDDSSMNEETLRVYVEKHIRDSSAGKDQSKTFKVADLRDDSKLRPFAERVVHVALKARASRRKQKDAGMMQAPVSPAKIREKVGALFASIIRTLLIEGVIVVGDVTSRPQGSSTENETISANAAFTSARAVMVGDDQASGDADTSLFWHRRAAAKQLHAGRIPEGDETYQLVTPSLLREPLRHLCHDRVGLSPKRPEDLLARLRATDVRWSHIARDDVLAALTQIE